MSNDDGITPRFLRGEDGVIYISEDGREALYDSIWEVKLSEDEILVGFELDAEHYKMARATKAALVKFAHDVLAAYEPYVHTETGSNSAHVEVTWHPPHR